MRVMVTVAETWQRTHVVEVDEVELADWLERDLLEEPATEEEIEEFLHEDPEPTWHPPGHPGLDPQDRLVEVRLGRVQEGGA